ncbi:MAG: TraV family lipoprotein [Trichlorobacter sp.]|jgi:conjugal transfer pilus assembly protein TraV
MSIHRSLLLGLAVLSLTGCAAMNPYASDFSCPKGHPGACVSVERAYRDSVETSDTTTTQPPENLVEQSRQRQIAALLSRPEPPLLAPPRVTRLLVLPYTGADNVLYLQRHLYLVLDPPHWLLSGHRDGDQR